MEYLISVALNVLSSFIYAAITAWIEALRGTPKVVVPFKGTQRTPYQEYQKEDNSLTPQQLRNRALLHRFSLLLVFNFVTFLSLYMAVVAPAEFRALSQKEPLLWSQARVFGDFLPDAVVAKEVIQWVPFVVAAILYVPLRYCANFAASILRRPWEWLGPYTWQRQTAVAMSIFLVISLVIGALTMFCYWPERTLAQCFTTTFMLALLAGIAFAAKPR